MGYSRDYKECAVRFKLNNHTYDETYEIFGMAESTLYEWIKEYKAGFPEKPKRTYEKKINKEALKQAVEERPDSELSELAQPFNCSAQAVFYALKNMGITLKKRHSPTLKNQKKKDESF